jgi:hypothetical protein
MEEDLRAMMVSFSRTLYGGFSRAQGAWETVHMEEDRNGLLE